MLCKNGWITAFLEKLTFWPLWPPYDPRLAFDPTKWIDDLKLMYMHELFVQAIWYGRVIAI